MIDTFLIGSVSGQSHGDDRMAHLMMGDDAALARIEQAIALFRTGDDALNRRCKIVDRHGLRMTARRQHRRFIDQIGEIGAREAGRQRGNLGGISNSRRV